MKIATWNINGIASRLDHVIKWSQTARPDVLCLQETKAPDAKFPARKLQNIGYEYIAVYGERAYNGVAILSILPLDDIVNGIPGDGEDQQRRVIAATVEDIRIVCAYFPHGRVIGHEMFYSKLDWVRRLRKYFDKYYSADDDLLLCGDTNICPHEMDMWNVRYWAPRIHFSKEEREVFQELKRWGFVDVFREFNDQPGEYTWWDTFRESSFPKNRGLRLDYMWASNSLAERCVDCWVDREPRGWDHPSDHAPVLAEFLD